MVLAMEVFPEPDSPISPTISPSDTLKETLSTALLTEFLFRKYFFKFEISRIFFTIFLGFGFHF